MLLQELSDIFAADGPLAQAAPGYRPRKAQLELAQAIEDTLRNHATLIAEAGTGTGKTWAYLVPAFLSGSKVLVSTGTRTLQDQLFRRDLPRLRNALALPISVALLKGRGNYVCHYHLERLSGDERALKSRSEMGQLRQIQVFAQQSKTGDRSDLSDVPEDADIWGRVTSTRENCLGQECPHVRDCFVLKARRQAQDADLVVVNHALFMADLALREEGITDLLPTVELVVFDEAHQLPDIATRFLGTSVSSHQLLDLARVAEAAGLAHARESTNWSEAGKRIEHAARALRLAAAPIEKMPGRKATFQAIPNPEEFDAALDELLSVLDHSIKLLSVVSEKHPDLAATAKTCLDIRAKLYQWTQPDRQGNNALKPTGVDADSGGQEAEGKDTGAAVRWVEHSLHHMRLHSAPLSVAQIFSRYRGKDQAWVLTSATLSVHGDFGHFLRQLGLWDAQTLSWESPFDYAAQGVLYVPKTLPLPSDRNFNERFVDALMPLIKVSTGGVLVLCTTLRAVDRIAEMLSERFEDDGIERLLLRQGESSRRALLERFRAGSNAVLVGSASFWEGIDVPGDALTLVAIDKLPFAPPDDPVLEARLNLCRSQGGNPFMEYQLPEAAIALKQGAGRLIRSELDWGVLMVGDTRMIDKPYGRLLWRGLPPFARTREPGQAVDFLLGKQEAS
ncbi:ATP-dependent helicase [Pusillimonas sp. T7-7]|uniref:ATP-dependent DNA helicase n=1 Tax=Pusillimonas sp. (strain T7-7) TaxID=1007105 RepID=UPI0002085145|nr:ATP-dependent DNA helicase [Pusillimonas sp. T7-7]AEC18976.1 ATP-dependent helicase [Pusillimonas sp. T7-7]